MSRGGTIEPAQFVDPKKDADTIAKAVKGMGCDKKTILELFATRSAFQRQLLADAYQAGYGESLQGRLSKELSGDFKQTILLSFNDQTHADAQALFEAMSGISTNDQILIDVLCTGNNDEIEALRDAYANVLESAGEDPQVRNLESDLKKNTSGDFQRLMIAVCQGMREMGCGPAMVEADEKALFDAGEGKLGTDVSTFIRIFATRSWQCLAAIDKKYEETRGHGLLKAIDGETSRSLKKSLQTILKSATNRTEVYAEILYNSMKGAGTRNDTLIRMIIGHSETDLAVIRYVFNGKYKESLSQMIKDDTSGEYRDFLLAILGELYE